MARWHHRLNGHEFEWIPGVGDGQGGLACCNSWGLKESDMTEWVKWTECWVTNHSKTQWPITIIYSCLLVRRLPKQVLSDLALCLVWHQVIDCIKICSKCLHPKKSQRMFKLRHNCIHLISAQFSSITQSCPTLCNPMDCSTPGLPVHHQLQTLLKLISIESVMPSNYLILCCSLLFPTRCQ